MNNRVEPGFSPTPSELQAEIERLAAENEELRETVAFPPDVEALIDRLTHKVAGANLENADLKAALARANQCLVDAGDSLLAQLGRFDELKAILSATPAPLAVVKGYYLPEQGFCVDPIDGATKAVQMVFDESEG